MTTESPLLFGKYQLLELVARGGMAEVFKAKSYGVEGFEKLVVIKRILPDLAQNQGFVDMFLNEARLSVALSHANIVQVFDLGREEDTYFIAMEYVLGMDFAQALKQCRRQGQRTPVELSVYVACEVARALDYAHRRRDALGRPLGVVHRDISPQNVLLSFEGEVKVTDFGIAKARTTIEEQGTVKGKYAYMAPEQAMGKEVDGRADIYALGVTLYEALAGINPFATPSPFETLRRVRDGEKAPLRMVNPDVPEELERIVETAMAPRAEERYAAAANLYEELSAFLYTTGKRVSPHDLAEWLQTVRAKPAAQPEQAKQLRDALDEDRSARRTPQETPAARGQHTTGAGRGAVTGPGGTGAGPGTGSGTGPGTGPGARPTTRPGAPKPAPRPVGDLRDVTMVALEVTVSHTFAGTSVPLDPLLHLAARYGAAEVERGEMHAVMVFGARDPDGRDTEAAVRCALKLHATALRAMAGADVALGVCTARLDVLGDGRVAQDEALGEAMATARDLAKTARTRILASAAVERLVGEQFALVPLPEGAARPAREGGRAFLVAAEKSAAGGKRKKVAGRKDLFRRFGDLLGLASVQGLQVVTVTGEAGVGKTRFLEEVHYRLKRMNHKVTWYVATCLPHEREVPLSALQAMLRAILAIDETDPESVMREKARRFRELGLSPEEMLAIGVVLGVVSATMESISTASRPLKSAVHKIATRLAQDQLTVLLWDAADHMDDATRALVDDLVRSGGKAQLMVVTASRPGAAFAWADFPARHEIDLGPLTEEESRQLVALRLGVASEAALPADLADDLWTKSRGNPLFLEEYLKALVESGVVEAREDAVTYRRAAAEVSLPKTLRGLVASRVARLDPAHRRLLQVAAVIGPRFFRDQIAGVEHTEPVAVDHCLGALVERGHLERHADEEYGFAHDLLRDVVYESLALDARRKLHATAATITERLFPERLDELAERMAHHWREAGDRARAVTYLERAARRLLREQAYEAAVASLARALELAQSAARPDPAHVSKLYVALGEAALAGRVTEGALDKLALGVTYAEELGDNATLRRLLVLTGRILAGASRLQEAVAHLERALSLADDADDKGARASIVSALGGAYAANGEFRRASGYLEEAVGLADAPGLEEERVYALTALARCLAAGGDRARALATLDQAVALAGPAAALEVRVEVEKTRAGVHFHTRDFAGASAAAAQAVELAREGGLQYELAVNGCNLGDAFLRLRDYKRAFAAFKESLGVAEEHGFTKVARLDRVYLAFIDATTFGKAESRAELEALAPELEAGGNPWDALQARYLLGLMCRELGERENAKLHLREALALASAVENRLYAEDCEAALRELSVAPPPAA